MTNHILISGPSASGKSSLIKMFLKAYPLYSLSVSHTTRPMRKGEVNGRDYHFVSKEVFEGMIKDNRMLEFTIFNNNYYGTSVDEVGPSLKVFDVEYEGVTFFKRKFPNFVFIFIDCNKQIMKERLIARGDKEEDIRERLRLYDRFEGIKWMFDKVIVNDKRLLDAFCELDRFIGGGQ